MDDLDLVYDLDHLLYRRLAGERPLLEGLNLRDGAPFAVEGKAVDVLEALATGLTPRQALARLGRTSAADEERCRAFVEDLVRQGLAAAR